MPDSPILAHAKFDSVRYANVWEDPRVLRRALRIMPGDRVLSIGAAGDNALALLLDDPAAVVAVDFSPAQVAVLHLKTAALATLDPDAFASFLGLGPHRRRRTTYQQLRHLLTTSSRRFWDERPALIEHGVLRAGRFEKYLSTFRRLVLPLVERRRDVDAFLACQSIDEQRALFEQRWNNRRWRALFRVFFGKTLLGRLGRDPAFFQFVEEKSVGEHFLRRAERAFHTLPVHDNFFLEWILTGRFSGRHGLPPYLDERHFSTLRARLERLHVVTAPLEGFLAGTHVDDPAPGEGSDAATRASFDAFNLSDCFEWMSPDATERLLSRIIARARPGARLCYWNLLVERRRPSSLAGVLRPDVETSAALSRIDRCFFYRDVVVERVAVDAR